MNVGPEDVARVRDHRIRAYPNGRFACDEHWCPGYSNILHIGPTFDLGTMTIAVSKHVQLFNRR